jgi:hypothetical protein
VRNRTYPHPGHTELIRPFRPLRQSQPSQVPEVGKPTDDGLPCGHERPCGARAQSRFRELHQRAHPRWAPLAGEPARPTARSRPLDPSHRLPPGSPACSARRGALRRSRLLTSTSGPPGGYSGGGFDVPSPAPAKTADLTPPTTDTPGGCRLSASPGTTTSP